MVCSLYNHIPCSVDSGPEGLRCCAGQGGRPTLPCEEPVTARQSPTASSALQTPVCSTQEQQAPGQLLVTCQNYTSVSSLARLEPGPESSFLTLSS